MSFSPPILPIRGQVATRDGWLRERLDTLLPELMARAGVDMWLVIAREYNEDPVIMSLLPAQELSARRRTILVFTRRPDGSVERLTLSRYGYGDLYTVAWDPDSEEQYDCLARIVRERDPRQIGVNTSRVFAFGDGLSYTERENLVGALGPELAGRLMGAEELAVGWLERRIAPELAAYPGLSAMAHSLIRAAYSRAAITPGVTTAEDLAWWMRQTLEDHGLRVWFHPTVSIQAPGQHYDDPTPRQVILPGDLLHCDVGFSYLGLCTDHQQQAYVLADGECEAPAGLRAALAHGNRLQDILLDQMGVGRTGNEVLRAALEQARAEGISPSIYTHALGYHGHAAGPTIGLWDRQEGVPGNGDYPLYDDTAYSIELNVLCEVPEWGGQMVRIALEEDAVLSGGRMAWLDGRQTELILI